MTRLLYIFFLCGLFLFPGEGFSAQNLGNASRFHALTLHGKPKYSKNFKHFDYVNPKAPKGGKMTAAAVGGFDSLNGFLLKGQSAAGIGMIYDTLLTSSKDEAFTEYGLLAEEIYVPKSHRWVVFKLRKEARFHDGMPVTAKDVKFSFNILREKGHPFYQSYYKDVKEVKVLDARRIQFVFKTGKNRELPLIIGQIPILPKHFWEEKDFGAVSLDVPLGSGPYRVKTVNPNRSISYERVKNYWGRKLAVNKGRYNFSEIQYDYYRDATVALEAFKAGEYDFRQENIAKTWATAYDFPDLRAGKVIKQEIKHENPTGMQGLFFNTRRDLFKNPQVREALSYAFDFEWMNKNFFYNSYKRTNSYFSNSELAAENVPTGAVRKILNKYRKQLPKKIFKTAYTVPQTDGSGRSRENLKIAKTLLEKSGWVVKKGKLVNAKTGAPFVFEILLINPSFERITGMFKKNLGVLGIAAQVRVVDSAQYQKRLDRYDFDMIVHVVGQSLSPGNEQKQYWHSENKDRTGGRNLAGVDNPVVDRLTDKILTLSSRKALISYTKALDHVLLAGYYVIPHWHLDRHRIAYKNKFKRPKTPPKYGLGVVDTWWILP
ncbi:MAG: extracellular solute-binding protein [Alphaproteobacteria bacterium]